MFKIGQVYKLKTNLFSSICPCSTIEITKIENTVSEGKIIYYLCNKIESSFYLGSYFSTELDLIRDVNSSVDSSTNQIIESKQISNSRSVKHKALF